MDLGQWWRRRRWRQLLEIIDQLPDASRLNEAIQNDPEQADLIAKYREERDRKASTEGETEGAEPWSPKVSEYNLTAALLRDLIGEVRSLQAHVIAAAGGKPQKVTPYPSPRTEVHRAMERRDQAWAISMAGRFGFTAEDF